MYPIGLSSCGKPLTRELFEAYRDAGIGRMEVSLDLNACNALDFEALAELSRESGVELSSFHLPFGPFNTIDLSEPSLADATVAYYETLIRAATGIGITIFVVHPSGEPIKPENRSARMACAKAHLADLAELAKTYGAVIAVEDLPRTCLGNSSEEMLELLSAHADLRVCFDTNHLLKEDCVSFIRHVGEKIITTHVSDYDFVNERHWLPGEGCLDWQAILGALEEIGYRGVWMYEIGFACPKTILRDRALTCADFVRNASEIFENKPFTVLSKPKPNLGKWE